MSRKNNQKNKKKWNKPVLSTLKGSELTLPVPVLLGFMRDVLAKGVSFRFRAKDLNAEPFIRDGEVVTVAPLSRALHRVGDIIVFIRPGEERPVFSQVFEVQRGACTVRGYDAGGRPKECAVPHENILGRVIPNFFLTAGGGDMEGERYTLNESGRAIWQCLDARKTLREVAAVLAEKYLAPRREIEKDILGLMAELAKRRMVVGPKMPGIRKSARKKPKSK